MAQLADYERQLALFVEAMAGRYLHIKAISEWPLEYSQLSLAHQSSDALFLPDELPGENPSSYRVLSLMQIGLTEFHTFEFRLSELLRLQPELGETDTTTKRQYRGDFEQWFSYYHHPSLLRVLFTVLERFRIEHRLCERYPGMGKHFYQWHTHHLGDDPLDYNALKPWSDRLDKANHQHGARRHLSDPLLAALLPPLWIRLSSLDADVYATSLAADQLYYQLLSSGEESGEGIVTDEAFDWLQREAQVKDWDEELAGLEGQLLAADLDNSPDIDALASDDLTGAPRPEELAITQLQTQRDALERRKNVETSAIQNALGTNKQDSRSVRYPEWDFNDKRYLANWCRLYEEPLIADESSSPADLRASVLPYLHAVLNQLRQIRPRGLVRIRPEAEGDELDLSALIESRLDYRAGVTPDDRLYSRQARLQRDLAVAFLVDLSASTDDPIEPPPAPDPAEWEHLEDIDFRDPYAFAVDEKDANAEAPRRIIDVQREAMLVMAIALDKLGDEFGIYGFSGYGKDCVEYFVAKELGDALTPRSLQMIAGMTPKRSTRMGPAVRHSIGKLTGSGRATKVLIVISDGFPQDSDYGPDRGSHEYGVQDTAKALMEAEAQGITTFCVTVDRAGHDYLRDMCPAQRYAVIEDIDGLPTELGKLYRTLTT